MSQVRTEQLTREAAGWFVRVHDESVTTDEFNDWQRWLAQSTAHRQAFQSVEDFWQDAGEIENAPWPSARELTDDTAVIPAKSLPRTRSGAGIQLKKLIPLAIAATLIVAIGAIMWLRTHSDFERVADSAVLTTARAEDKELELSDGSRVSVGAHSQLGVNLNAAARNLDLKSGEAYFKVAHELRRKMSTALISSCGCRSFPRATRCER